MTIQIERNTTVYWRGPTIGTTSLVIRPSVLISAPDVRVLYATAYPAELGIWPLGYYKPVQHKILGSGTCTMLDDL